MLNRKKIDDYWKNRTEIADQQVSARHRADDAPKYDIAFIRKYLQSGTHILDLGAGSCVLADALSELPEVEKICAVEKFRKFFEKRPDKVGVETIESDVLDYSDKRTYDIVMLFGVLNYFEIEDSAKIYQKCAEFLNPSGLLLVKHQCGVAEDIRVDHFSKELGHHYQAIYRSKEHEVSLLKQNFVIKEIVDVYPPHLNRWENTHFFGFVCQKK